MTNKTEGIEPQEGGTQAEEQHEAHPQPTASDYDELKELLLRTQANFENFRKQTEKRMEEFRQSAAKDVILELLPILDNFQLALRHTLDGKASEEFVKGVELIYAQLISLMESQGVNMVMSVGQKFDPYLHEPLLRVESELPENTIVEEFCPGYTFQGAILRHAKVKLSAGKKNHISEKRDEEKNNN